MNLRKLAFVEAKYSIDFLFFFSFNHQSETDFPSFFFLLIMINSDRNKKKIIERKKRETTREIERENDQP